ncbi:hypothetical protein PybrP1_011890 [[Pythium] brassicae (nom. inval.)]|nr:hypothetical protein PybrP1_011890 [[Pythium] brassicae (nom. inval.)]
MSLPCVERNAAAVRPDRLAVAAGAPDAPPMKRKVSAAGAPDTCGRKWQSRLYVLFVLIVLSCALGLVSVASLIQRQSAGALRGNADTQTLVVSIADATAANPVANENNGGAQLPPATAAATTAPVAPTPAPTYKLPVAERWRALGGDDLSQFECVAWRRTSDCTPDGKIEEQEAKPCSEEIPDGVSGFCEIRRTDTGALYRVLAMHCDSLRPGVRFACADFREMLEYGHQAPLYTHDAGFSFAKCQEELVDDQALTGVLPPALDTAALQSAARSLSFARGIALVVYEKLFESVFASIRSLRAMGCTLPIELWYIASETNVLHPVLQTLTRDYGAFLREIKDPRATRFYTKLHAVFYSAFDQVLLLDSDNFSLPDKNVFCGVTMVQHDTNREILFLHRNQEKLSSENHRVVWEHVQDFLFDAVPLEDYDVRGANGGRYYPDFKRCYGKDIYYEKSFSVTPVANLPFAGLERKLLGYVTEAAELTKAWKAQEAATPSTAPAAAR